MIEITIDEGDAYDRLSIALVKSTKNPHNTTAQDNFARMYAELARAVGHDRHNQIVGSPEFAALRDVNGALYDHTGETAKPTRPPQQDDQQTTNRLNYARYQSKGALQVRFFGSALKEQKFGMAA